MQWIFGYLLKVKLTVMNGFLIVIIIFVIIDLETQYFIDLSSSLSTLKEKMKNIAKISNIKFNLPDHSHSHTLTSL